MYFFKVPCAVPHRATPPSFADGDLADAFHDLTERYAEPTYMVKSIVQFTSQVVSKGLMNTHFSVVAGNMRAN
jgi:hypothetical protein